MPGEITRFMQGVTLRRNFADAGRRARRAGPGDEALKKDQRPGQALLLRARISMQSGNTEAIKTAGRRFERGPEAGTEFRSGLYFMAQAKLCTRLADQARAFAGDLERNYPDYLPAKLMQVQINLAAGDPKQLCVWRVS